MNISRREFLKNSAVMAGSVSLPGLLHAFPEGIKMPTRAFGKTGYQASIYTVGTAEIPANEESVRALRSLFIGGVNMLDTAPSYMGTRSESVVGEAIEGYRKNLWISTKTLERSADGAYREIKESLKRLRCDHVDLLQVHAVNDAGTLDSVLRKGGAVEGIERAVKDGLVRYIGISGHTRPEVILKAINNYPFASILIPVSAMDANLNDFATDVVPAANKKQIAIVGMKSLKGIERAKPGQFDPQEFIRYSLSKPISTLNLGLRVSTEAAENLKTILAFKPMTSKQLRDIEQSVAVISTANNLWWKHQ